LTLSFSPLSAGTTKRPHGRSPDRATPATRLSKLLPNTRAETHQENRECQAFTGRTSQACSGAANGGKTLMNELSEEKQRQILEAPPRGTYAVILVIGIAMLLAWLYFFFGLFMSHGPVN
jgi:hypothetical protein